MNAHKKPDSKKQIWTAMRRRYTWQLRPPFKTKFDRTHWWKDKEKELDVTPSAALYELARRHPLVREAWLRNFAAATHSRRGVAVWHPGIRENWESKIIRPVGDLHWPCSLNSTCHLGLKSWAKLDWTEQRNWEFGAGNLKGLDFRGPDIQCRDIVPHAKSKLFYAREDTLKATMKFDGITRDELMCHVRQDFAMNPPTAKEWEAAIAVEAIKAHREGLILLAIVPDLAAEKAASVLAQKYREHFQHFSPSKPNQRARWQDWLPLISEFEDAETSRAKAKSQNFIRYRRALDGICFE